MADERPREAECYRPYGRQRPEHRQGQCARDEPLTLSVSDRVLTLSDDDDDGLCIDKTAGSQLNKPAKLRTLM